MQTMKIWIAAIYHCDGLSFQPGKNDLPYFESEELARESIYEFVKFYWEHEGEIEEKMPENKQDAIDEWFKRMNETYLVHGFDMPVPSNI